MKRIFKPLFLLGSLSFGVLTTTASEVRFNSSGFAIEPPIVRESGQDYTAVSMFLEPSEGFAPNVNVRKVHFDGTMNEFMEASIADFESMEWEILDARVLDDGSMVLEATGTYDGLELHWYLRAVRSREAFYLATGTTLQSQWMDVGRVIRRSADSIRTLRR